MVQLADQQGLKTTERIGGLLFDEMAIQEDLVVTHQGATSFFTGQVDLGDHGNQIRIQRKGRKEVEYRSNEMCHDIIENVQTVNFL